MRLPFNGSYNVTQRFNDECCRASYARFGMQGHNGIDYGMPTNSPVLAAHGGKVATGYEANGYGNYVFITGEGYESVYGHLNRVTVTNGQTVNAGDQIGSSGSTGNSTGPHLHFGVRPIGYNRANGFLGYIDPQPLFNTTEGVVMNQEDANMVAIGVMHTDPKAVSTAYFIGDKPKDAIYKAMQTPQGKEVQRKLETYQSLIDQAQSQQDQITKQAAEIAILKAQIVELGKQPVITEDAAAAVVREKVNPIVNFIKKVMGWK